MPENFKFEKGTVIVIGNEPITLTRDSYIHFDRAGDEQYVVGLLVNSGNLDVNRINLQFKYNGFGQLLSLAAQAETSDSLESYVLSLSDEDAARLDAVELRAQFRAQIERDKADFLAAEEAERLRLEGEEQTRQFIEADKRRTEEARKQADDAKKQADLIEELRKESEELAKSRNAEKTRADRAEAELEKLRQAAAETPATAPATEESAKKTKK